MRQFTAVHTQTRAELLATRVCCCCQQNSAPRAHSYMCCCYTSTDKTRGGIMEHKQRAISAKLNRIGSIKYQYEA